MKRSSAKTAALQRTRIQTPPFMGLRRQRRLKPTYGECDRNTHTRAHPEQTGCVHVCACFSIGRKCSLRLSRNPQRRRRPLKRGGSPLLPHDIRLPCIAFPSQATAPAKVFVIRRHHFLAPVTRSIVKTAMVRASAQARRRLDTSSE